MNGNLKIIELNYNKKKIKMKENRKKINNTEKEWLCIVLEEDMKVSGLMENLMD